MTSYGDETDCATMSLLTLNDGPFFTLIALGTSGLANVPLLSLLAAIVPILVGMIIGNFDKKMKEFLEPGCNLLVP
ncbi:2-keto-3-deoxygluconate permease, partial [Staphylococcus aureus]